MTLTLRVPATAVCPTCLSTMCPGDCCHICGRDPADANCCIELTRSAVQAPPAAPPTEVEQLRTTVALLLQALDAAEDVINGTQPTTVAYDAARTRLAAFTVQTAR